MTKDVRTLTPDDIQFAKNVARWMAVRYPGLDPEDLEGIAMLQLCESARRWRPDGGASLRSFAFGRICGAIHDAGRVRWGRYSRRYEYPFSENDHAVAPIGDAVVGLGEVLTAAAELPDQLIALLINHRMEGKTLQMAGARMGISKSWASRLNDRLTEELEKLFGERSAA